MFNAIRKHVSDLVFSLSTLVGKTVESRKAVAAIGGFATALAAGNTELAVAVILAYVGIEGAADYKSR